jgi:hypothetical protein
MIFFRMVLVALRIGRPYTLRPWRSPLVRWRIETYGYTDASGKILHADQITPRDVRVFFLRNLKPLSQFLRWAAVL